jgi:hypothetical protein
MISCLAARKRIGSGKPLEKIKQKFKWGDWEEGEFV